MDLEPWQFLIITQIIIFLLGWPLEWTEILIIFVPIFLPLLETFGGESLFLCNVNCFKSSNVILNAAHGYVGLLLKGCSKKQCRADGYF